MFSLPSGFKAFLCKILRNQSVIQPKKGKNLLHAAPRAFPAHSKRFSHFPATPTALAKVKAAHKPVQNANDRSRMLLLTQKKKQKEKISNGKHAERNWIFWRNWSECGSPADPHSDRSRTHTDDFPFSSSSSLHFVCSFALRSHFPSSHTHGETFSILCVLANARGFNEPVRLLLHLLIRM